MENENLNFLNNLKIIPKIKPHKYINKTHSTMHVIWNWAPPIFNNCKQVF